MNASNHASRQEQRRSRDVKRIRITERTTKRVSVVQTPDSMCRKWSRQRMQSIQFGALANRSESGSIRVEDLWGCLWPNWALGIDSLFPVAFSQRPAHTGWDNKDEPPPKVITLWRECVFIYLMIAKHHNHDHPHTHTLTHYYTITAEANQTKWP